MKRLWMVVVLYLAVAALMIVLAPEQDGKITLMVVEQLYSRVITNLEETLEIPLYATLDNSFFTDEDLIRSVRIRSDENEIDLEIEAIHDQGQSVEYEGIPYFVYLIRLSLDAFAGSQMEIHLPEAILEITYENDIVMALGIGEVSLYFKAAELDQDFDFFRLSGLYSDRLDTPELEGILIGFDQFKAHDILIEAIGIGSDQILLDTENKVLIHNPDQKFSLFQRLPPDYQFVIEGILPLQSRFEPVPSQLYAIPLVYRSKTPDLWRFPIIIRYLIDGMEKTAYIDDFIFKSHSWVLKERESGAHLYSYQY
jgi:hypothetical protein